MQYDEMTIYIVREMLFNQLPLPGVQGSRPTESPSGMTLDVGNGGDPCVTASYRSW